MTGAIESSNQKTGVPGVSFREEHRNVPSVRRRRRILWHRRPYQGLINRAWKNEFGASVLISEPSSVPQMLGEGCQTGDNLVSNGESLRLLQSMTSTERQYLHIIGILQHCRMPAESKLHPRINTAGVCGHTKIEANYASQ